MGWAFFEKNKNNIMRIGQRRKIQSGWTTKNNAKNLFNQSKDGKSKGKRDFFTHISVPSCFVGHMQTVQNQIRRGV